MQAGTGITFSKKNILLAFDDIECDRTASFKIPATPTNDAALGLAKNYNFTGSAMRTRMQATMIDGTIVKTGELYVSAYEPGAYTCVFIYGENLTLKALKESGGINTYLNNASIIPDSIPWSVSFDTTTKNIGMAVYYNYWTGEANVLRSWRAPHPYANFGYLLRKAAQRKGITLVNMPAAVDQICFVINGDLLAGTRESASFGNTIPLYANLPSWTLVDMLKIAAALTGTLLIVTDGSVRFFSSDASTMRKKDLSGSIISFGKMERKVGDYAQQNTIVYDKGDEMLASYGAVDPTIQAYEIDNVNIAEKKELYKLEGIVKPETLPLTDYGGVISSVKNRTYTSDQTYEVDYWEKEFLFASASTIPAGCTQAGKIGLKELQIALGGGFDFITQLCNKSTQISAKVRLSHLELEDLTPDTLIHINGADYVWREMQWSSGSADLTLCQV